MSRSSEGIVFEAFHEEKRKYFVIVAGRKLCEDILLGLPLGLSSLLLHTLCRFIPSDSEDRRVTLIE
jgi:hypothetical protein